MKKTMTALILMLLVLAFSILMSACTAKDNKQANEDFIEITENLYVHWINDIYTNTDEYIGKTIEIKGMFSMVVDKEVNKDRYYVFRVGPGCCANDGSMCGFEIQSSENMDYKEQQWIKVRGKLKTYEQGVFTYLYLDDCKISKMKKGENPSVSN